VDPRILPGQRVTVFGVKTLRGVVGAKPPHLLTAGDRKKNYQREELYVDVGFPPDKVREWVRLGDQVQLEHRYVELLNGRAAVKTCDDRACVAAMYHALKMLEGQPHAADLYFVASSQEEVGGRGAGTGAFALEPDFAVALDVCHADTPGAPQGETLKIDFPAVGMGPYLHPVLREKLLEVAREHNVQVQHEVMPRSTGTDADKIGVSRGGVPTALLELPLKYMHTTVETLDTGSLKECGRLLARFAAAVSPAWEDELWT
jgi:endoglucanase